MVSITRVMTSLSTSYLRLSLLDELVDRENVSFFTIIKVYCLC